MPWEPFIEPNLGPVLPSRPYVVRNSHSAPYPFQIPAVKHRQLEHAIQDLVDCRQRFAEATIRRHAEARAHLHRVHQWELGLWHYDPETNKETRTQ